MLQSGLIGIVDDGGAYAVLAVCLILLYRTTGVVNFAVAATGTAGSFIVASLYGQGMNLALSIVIGVICGGLISIVCGLLYVRYFFDASLTHRAAVAIALLISIAAITIRVFSDQPRLIPTIVPGTAFKVAGVVVSVVNLSGLFFALVLTGLVTGILNRTHRGLQLRAISQGPVASELLGVPVKPLSLAAWAGTGAVGTIAILLIAPGVSSEIQSLSLLVVPALAVTLVGALRLYWVAFVAAMTLAGLQGLMSYSQTWVNYEQIVPFGVILGVLIWNQRKEVWDEER